MKFQVLEIPEPIKEEAMSAYDQLIAKGKAEGKLEGKAEGIAEGKAEVVINSFKNGISISMISNITGLTIKEVEEILTGNKK